MSLALSLLLFDSTAYDSGAQSPLIAVAGLSSNDVSPAQCGGNGLFIHSGSLAWRTLSTAHHNAMPMQMSAFDFQVFNAEQRRRTRLSRVRITEYLIDEPVPALAQNRPTTFVATLAVVHHEQHDSVYHYAHEGEGGALFLHLLDLPSIAQDSWTAWLAAAQTALAGAAALRPLLSDDCWYTKWRPEMELERKFTSPKIPDMWQLATDMHATIAKGGFEGFVLELDRDFQYYDYESHIFEVSGEPSETGYIAFIPQADGLMAVKRKWFLKNDELRREDFSINHAIPFDTIEQYARSMTSAAIRRLKPFRRTRFDVNCESLEHGNGFGTYFDICRMVDGSASFAQIEVEYCRSRTLKPLRGIEDDFERLSTIVHAFLFSQGLSFTHDLYSKLDFVREATPLAA